MNYQKIYNQLINRAKREERSGEGEIHHILPKSMGGDNSEANLVFLTHREHFIAHKLLWKIHKTKVTAYAYICLVRMSNKVCVSSREFERVRKLSAELSKQRMLNNNPVKSGSLNHNHVGLWITPFGVFETVKEAEAACGVSKSAIQRRCRNSDKVVTAPRLGLSKIGKTWKELGWDFIPKEVEN